MQQHFIAPDLNLIDLDGYNSQNILIRIGLENQRIFGSPAMQGLSEQGHQGAADRFDEVLEEIPRVREDLGFIPLIHCKNTDFAAFFGAAFFFALVFFLRFAPAAAEEAEMQEVLARTRKLMVEVERASLKPVGGAPEARQAEAPS